MARKRDQSDFMEAFGAVRKRVSAVATEMYAGVEVGTMQARLLRHIGAGTLTQAELARATDSDPPLTGRAVAGLIERGWVRRDRSDTDRREYQLHLTPNGKRALEKIEKVRHQFLSKIDAALDDRDLEDFDRIKQKILDALA